MTNKTIKEKVLRETILKRFPTFSKEERRNFYRMCSDEFNTILIDLTIQEAKKEFSSKLEQLKRKFNKILMYKSKEKPNLQLYVDYSELKKFEKKIEELKEK